MRGLWLLLAVGLMLGITVYPPLFTQPDGHVDHTLATLLLWAMSAGLVAGVGYVPQWRVPRWLLSGPAMAALLLLASLRLWG
ncbi:MAG TPA: cyd operon YbgE family protein [Burkholderiaceae bacterium]|nr:cyd operon YbgE family protein [Burkholderiaceae bacterium]